MRRARCALCGRSFEQLHKHVRIHGLDAWAYYGAHLAALRAQVAARIKRELRVPALGPCWISVDVPDGGGYGRMRIPPRGTVKLHRVSLWAFTGAWPGDALVRHRCDVRRCCRPSHLELGDHVANMADRAERGRTARGSQISDLEDLDVRVIRHTIEHGEGTRREVAERFGLSTSAVDHIVARRSWAHLEPVDEIPW